jgi:iron complex outermembrane receptor protein
LAVDLGSCDADRSCTRQVDGSAHHVGLEGNQEVRWGDWAVGGSAMWLRARREGASDPANNGLTPENVAERSLRLNARAPLSAFLPVPAAWTAQATVAHEGRRAVLPDDSIWLPGWTVWSLGTSFSAKESKFQYTWGLQIENLFDQRAWQESPYQYGHAYLYPLAPRRLGTSLNLQW